MPLCSGRWRAWRSGLLYVPEPRRFGPLCLLVRGGLRVWSPCGCVPISHARQSPMSHVIPLHIFQTLKSDRWNCNVCGPSRKMTTINYVRNLAGGSVVAAHGCRGRAPSFVAGPGTAVVQHPSCRRWWGFCSIRNWLAVCRRRVGVLMTQFPRVLAASPRLEGIWPPTEAMSHVIPLHIFQTLKSDRWNCNVCGPSRKMTTINYVRLLVDVTPDICHGITCIKGHFRPH